MVEEIADRPTFDSKGADMIKMVAVNVRIHPE